MTNHYYKKIFVRIVFVLVMLFIGNLHFTEATNLTKEQIEAERARLKNEIVKQEMEIQQERIRLMNTKKERQGYEAEVAKLNAKIREANAIIRKRRLAIKELDYEAMLKEQNINQLNEKLKREKESLAQMLRKTYQYDDVTLTEIILDNRSVTEMFDDLDNFDSIKRTLKDSFINIEEHQKTLLAEKEGLLEAKGSQEELKMIQERQKREVAEQKAAKARLAKQKKVEEKHHELTIKEKEKLVASIRARLFALRDSNSGDVSFGTMLKYAKEASARTGVSPALILAILTVETNLGKELGVGKWYEDMHPTRDVPIFKEITAELGLDPDKMPVSARPCSAAKRKAVGPGKRCGYGYGGAMGPAQFIPSTWVLYKKRIARISGQNPPNPWDPRTAVFATALLMMDNGADKGTRKAEHKAAVRYLAGWRNAEKSEYWWYGDKTMRYRDQYAKDIAALEE